MDMLESLKKTSKMMSSKISNLNIDEQVAALMKANFNRDLIKKRELFIPQALLEKRIAEILSDQVSNVDARLESFVCKEDCIEIAINTKKKIIENSVIMTLRIHDLEISRDRQIAVCHIGNEKVSGNNFAGKICAGILSVTVSDIVHKAVSSKDIADIATFSTDTRLLSVDLSKLEPIQKLMEPIGVINLSLLDVLDINVSHRNGGLAVSARLNSKSEKIAESMDHLKSAAFRALRCK